MRNGEREAAIEMIKMTACKPLQPSYMLFNDTSAFHIASSQHDLQMLLWMVAADYSTDNFQSRFFVSTDTFELAPIVSREEISSARTIGSTAFFAAGGSSAEGFEVMAMYGYKIQERDLHNAVDTQNIQAVKLALALDTLPTSRQLGLAVARGNLELAELLLKGGADVNGYTGGNTPYDSWPCLWIATKLGRVDLARLLIQYGATVGEKAQISTWEGGEDTEDEDERPPLLNITTQTALELANLQGSVDMQAVLMETQPNAVDPAMDRFAFITGLKRDFEATFMQSSRISLERAKCKWMAKAIGLAGGPPACHFPPELLARFYDPGPGAGFTLWSLTSLPQWMAWHHDG